MIISDLISELVLYGLESGLLREEDRAFAISALMDVMDVDSFEPSGEVTTSRPLNLILGDMLEYMAECGKLDGESIAMRDLFDTRIMGAITPVPSAVIDKFFDLYRQSPALATDYFYSIAKSSNYIRVDRIKKDLKWQVESDFGTIDITVNLSKPEKDPKAIALARLSPQTDYPRCALCHENEGFRGTLTKAARQTLRQIPFEMAGEKWYLQYSPYVYYNEHCIALSAEHKPMSINTSTFAKLTDFTTVFPHYFIGSNADLPIVGGSILSHDHMQGGRYTFPIERAKEREKIEFSGFEDVYAAIVDWPMSVIRLRSENKDKIVELSDKILSAWREYSDRDAFIFSHTGTTPHNTITPIARRRGEEYEMDLVLRNNITTDDHPMGVYHPHAEHHNIKKENIGLIEVMGLAVLPSRLKAEMEIMVDAILSDRDFSEIPEIEKHKAWYCAFRDNYTFTKENTESILKEQIGKTFVRVLSDAGVYKNNEGGRAAFLRFIDSVNRA